MIGQQTIMVEGLRHPQGVVCRRCQAHISLEPVETIVPQVARLTMREHQVATMVVEGKTNFEISLALRISEQMVKNYLGRVFRYLGLRNRIQLALMVTHGRLILEERPLPEVETTISE